MILIPEIKDPVLRYDGTSYTLTGALCDYKIDDTDYDIVRSVIDYTADIIEKGVFFRGSIDYFGLAEATYASLKLLKGHVVRLWPFGTGQKPASSKWYPYVDVIVTSVRPYHREKKYYYDAAIIEFESEKPYALAEADDSGIPATPPES